MKTIAVIPAHNEAETIQKVVAEVKKYVHEIIVVDDGSTDSTRDTALGAGAAVVSHALNRGVGAALRTGYRAALNRDPDVVIQIDGDFQHDPSYIPRLLEAVEKSDIVIGSRFLNPSHKNYNLTRRSGIKFFSWVANTLGSLSVTDVTSGFRCYRASALRQLTPLTDQHWALEQTLEAARKGMTIKEISVEMPVRGEGRSQFDLETYALYPFKMVDCIIKILIFR
ncbi:MAG: glycosyltransferase family 2 protein [Theionarchaea archaeon]|nr:glycosyltransferase family 2 protein [Theionarchaea archaeon]MBU7038357.1 glycosyltransferase family 2 protein [Theionarchaea archaeon]